MPLPEPLTANITTCLSLTLLLAFRAPVGFAMDSLRFNIIGPQNLDPNQLCLRGSQQQPQEIHQDMIPRSCWKNISLSPNLRRAQPSKKLLGRLSPRRFFFTSACGEVTFSVPGQPLPSVCITLGAPFWFYSFFTSFFLRS